MSTATVSIENNALCVSGDITLHNVMTLYRESLLCLKKQSVTKFDFSRLKSSDSAVIALMVEWQRYCQAKGQQASFLNLPSQCQAVIKAANLNVLFH